ncbi:hypothetical protein [Aquimarina sp. AD10]|uniref:hypothetical protein n=1 Tax=Aquimarina sp. AD10 TaxID=1714849 RepID=UPI000EA8913E|nr:hypothetical protein [Aquimarina sp. AD10]
MAQKIYILIILLTCTTLSCQDKMPIDNIKTIPKTTEKDNQYKNVFSILDGTWKGQFLIFEDHKRLSKDKIDLKNISLSNLKKEGLNQINSIDVKQVYTSTTALFQTVVITDFYPDTGQKITSKGVNKIQDGQMWCVVRKPDETVIHQGSTQGSNTIIWQRDEKKPQKIEYFKETVSKNFYEIIGWGYYDGDDTTLTPKLWFYAKYERQ